MTSSEVTAGELLRERIAAELALNGVELDGRELGILDTAVAVANDIQRLEEALYVHGAVTASGRVSPIAVEVRMARASLLAHVKSLDLTGSGSGGKTAAANHGRAAAGKRWGNRGTGI